LEVEAAAVAVVTVAGDLEAVVLVHGLEQAVLALMLPVVVALLVAAAVVV
jgi:hypothetical protein